MNNLLFLAYEQGHSNGRTEWIGTGVVRTLMISLACLLPSRFVAAACTAQEVQERRAIAWDRASLLEMADLEGGRSLHRRMLGMMLAGQTSGPNVDRDKLCAQYDEITRSANEGLARFRR